MIHFSHEYTDITNPTSDEAGFGIVTPDYYGFSVWDSGGGCTAWRKDLPDGTYLLITSTDGGSHEYDTEFLYGHYLPDDDGTCLQLLTMEVGNVPEPEPLPVSRRPPSRGADAPYTAPSYEPERDPFSPKFRGSDFS
jgi:hypothetical protein